MSLRSNGSYIGYNRVTTTAQDSASGIWSLAAAERRRRAAAWPMPFLPSNVTGLQLWLDASDASTLYDATSGGSLVAADGAVARWEDKSGNARHATQGTSANRPARKTAIQGGKDVLRFDGSNDSLSIPSSTATFKFLHSANSTVFVVFKSGTTADPGHAYYGVIYTSESSFSQIGYGIATFDASPSNNGIDLIVVRGVGGSGVLYNPIEDGFPSNEFSLASFVTKPTDATAANRSSYRNNGGAASANNTWTGTPSTNNSQADFTIAMIPVANNSHLNGDIAEIIIYDSALSDTDREAVENYLLAKWAIS